MQFEGIHHISAITGDARRNVDFYTRVLGLRLTAKTVNQDDPGVYHLFYGDEDARPGADLTFFEYPDAIPGRPGAGMVHRIVHRVGSADALAFWAERLGDEGVAVRPRRAAACASPIPRASTTSWSSTAPTTRRSSPSIRRSPPSVAIRGFEGVRAYSFDPAASAALLEGLMGAQRSDDRFELRGDQARRLDRLRPGARRARPPERGHRAPHRLGHVRRAT